jgi:hypothetical protein
MFTRKGLWYETNRNRWRVRLYEGRRIKHLSYHYDHAEAVRVFQLARAYEPHLRRIDPHSTRTKDLLTRLRNML